MMRGALLESTVEVSLQPYCSTRPPPTVHPTTSSRASKPRGRPAPGSAPRLLATHSTQSTWQIALPLEPACGQLSAGQLARAGPPVLLGGVGALGGVGRAVWGR